jgi:hypothetical protein
MTADKVNVAEAALPVVSGGAKDEALIMVGEHQQTLDPAVVARAVRKIDLFLIPAMVFGCQFESNHWKSKASANLAM